MATEVQVCNLALAHLGISKRIANLTTDLSAEKNACAQFFEIVRDSTLRRFHWPFATKVVSMALVSENPSSEWRYAYRYPTDCKQIRRFLSGTRNDSRQTRVPYKLYADDAGILVYTDDSTGEIEYTKAVDDPTHWPDDFVMALSLRLAAYLGPTLTAGDPFKKADRALQLFLVEMTGAEAAAVNEQQDEEPPQGEFVDSRTS